MFEKIWDRHTVVARPDGATLLHVARHLVHEGSRAAFRSIAERGLAVRHPEQTFATPDHYVSTASHVLEAIPDPNRREMVSALGENTAAHGIRLYGLGDRRQGIVHVIGPEQGITLPGLLMTCGDSHTATHGALGALAFGIGASEVTHVLATQTLWQMRPKSMRVSVEGSLGLGVSAKDVILAIIAAIGVNDAMSLANTRIDFSFVGRPSHAAASPHLGRSALDAVELMNVGVNYMREHMPSDARIHYAYLDTGGIAPNVVQGTAKIRYAIRARELPELWPLIERVKKVAEGAALMTETTVTHQVVSAVSNLLGNTPLAKTMHAAFERLGPPPFDDADREYARQIQTTLSPEDITTAFRRIGAKPDLQKPLCDEITPLDAPNEPKRGAPMMGSTDVGDVSWVVPTVQARGATYAIGTPGHSWQLTAQGKSGIAHKGMIHVAKIMASTAVDALANPAIIEQAKADYATRTATNPYICPLPTDVMPPIKKRA